MSIAHAGVSYWNRTSNLYPAGGLDELNNWEYKDAAAYCDRERGRVFTFQHDYSFPLFGLSVLVMVDPSNESRFDPSLLRLSLFKQADGPQPLASSLSPSSAKIIQRENDGSPTFDVYFGLSPPNNRLFFDGASKYKAVLECLTDDARLYRLWEAKNLKTGDLSLYNSATGQESSYPDPGKKLLFSLFRPKESSVYPASAKLPESTDKTPGVSLPPRFHPVVLIHGLGGRPENWSDETKGTNYQKLLTDWGYPKDYLHFYSYGYKWGQYNYQGDVREISANLESVVGALSALHKSQGGDGKVDLLGYSLGTLVARQYLNTHKNNHQIRKFIAVGAPFKGSWVMDLDRGIREIPGVGIRIERPLASLLVKFLIRRGIMGGDQPLNLDSIAAQQLRSDSDFIAELNRPSNGPRDTKAYSIYSDIKVTFEQKLFASTVKKNASIGDGVILPESASSTSNLSSTSLVFSESKVSSARLSKTAGAAFNIEWPEIESVGLLHNNMLKNENINSKIKELLMSD